MTKHIVVNKACCWLLALAFMAVTMVVPVRADDEYQEAIKQTEEQWQAVRQTMQQSKTKFDDFRKKYQEYEDAVFSQDPEKGIELARRLFKLDKNQTQLAKDKLRDLREMFNTLDKNGLKSKLEDVAGKLKFADNVAGEVSNVWEFSKKFDPANAKDNPTYGLRLIGTLLKDGAGKMEKIPLVGQILGKWIAAYGEVAGDFANALDRLGKKIESFRGGSLCGQLGYKTDQQKAFESADPGGEDCLTYFPWGGFGRLRAETYEGNKKYFFFDPSSKRGYFADQGNASKVYEWHQLLLDMRALDADWLSSRANSLKPEVEKLARQYYGWFSGWKNKSDDGWIIIEKLGLYQDAYFYGRLDEETFVANFILVDKHNSAVRKIVAEYEKYILVGGTVFEEDGGGRKESNGAKVEFRVGGKNYNMTTGANGQYELLMEGKVGDGTNENISKDGFESIQQSGAIPARVIRGNNYTLSKEAMKSVISGTVFFKEYEDKQAVGLAGATVTAAAGESTSLGSATSGGDGSYSLTVQVTEGVQVSLTATKDESSGSATVTVASPAHAGVDITVAKEAEVEDTAKWTINVTVLDGDGKPLSGATVAGGPAAASTSDGGKAVIGPIPITEKPYSLTLTASIQVKDGSTVKGAATTVPYEDQTTSNVTLTIAVETPEEVTIFGRVTDANNIGIDGAAVTGGTLAATSSGGGSFSMGPITMTKGQSVDVTASMSDGTASYASAPQTVTYDGTSKKLSTVLIIDVESFQDVTITGRVTDLNGKPLEGASVSCSGVSSATDGSGTYTLPPINCKLGGSLNVSATFTTDDGTAVAGQTAVVPKSENATAPNIVLDVVQEEVWNVVVIGNVVDGQGTGIGGATVSSGGASSATDGSGGYTLGPVECINGKSMAISATVTADDGSTAAGQVSITPQSDNEAAPDIVIQSLTGKKNVTISGRVVSTDGANVSGAVVTGGGQSTTTDNGGSFTLPAFEHELGTPVTVSATTTGLDGNAASGTASVTPVGEQASVSIAIDLGSEEGDGEGDDDVDDLIDELEDDVDEADPVVLDAQFHGLVGQLDGIASEFFSYADNFDQRLRELGEDACNNSSVAYSLSAAKTLLRSYGGTLDGLFGVYADLTAAAATQPGAVNMATADNAFDRVVEAETAMEGRLAAMQASYGAYKCDEESSETDGDDRARDDADSDDVDDDTDIGGGVEVCGDGIDNDGDNEIDECDAGCCTKNVQITVTDCGAAADDIFLVSVDGSDVGVTPKGAANTFNIELEPGDHSVRITCLDDGGDPLGNDVGTVCVSVVAFSQDASVSGGLGGGEGHINYGGSDTFSFTVPTGPVQPGMPQHFDGSTLRHLEQ